MTVRESIVEKIMAAGWDMFASCEEADRIIKEFLASGKDEDSFGVIGAGGKCQDVICLIRSKKAVNK